MKKPKKPRGFLRKIRVKSYPQTRDVRKLPARGSGGRFRKRRGRKVPPSARQIKLF